jgi:hypothetical protein
MSVLGKRQDASSPWAFVAFEAEGAGAIWEAFEPEPVQPTHFAPFEYPAPETPNLLPSAVPAEIDSSALMPAPQMRIEAGVNEATPEFEERLRVLEETHQAALAQLERKYTVELAGKLTSKIELQGVEMADEIGSRLARLLAPILFDHARTASLAALTRDLQRILVAGEAHRIVMSGPRKMVMQVQAELGEQASRLQIEETDTVDVTVRLDSEILATRLSAWSAVLKDVLA